MAKQFSEYSAVWYGEIRRFTVADQLRLLSQLNFIFDSLDFDVAEYPDVDVAFADLRSAIHALPTVDTRMNESV